MAFVLGLDIGSTTTKACLLDVAHPTAWDGLAEVHVVRAPTPEAADELLAVVASLLHACAEVATTPIAAVGIASMAETGIPLDANGDALTPLLRWNGAGRRAALHGVLERHPDLPIRRGLPATPKPTLIALSALRAGQQDLFSTMRAWRGVADLIVESLTGRAATDHTLATRTMLWDEETGWDGGLLDEIGCAPSMFAHVLAPGECAGRVSEAASTLGIPVGTPVHVAGHDHVVGAWAAGTRLPGQTADSLGTAEAIVRITDDVDTAAAVGQGFSVGYSLDRLHRTLLAGSPACGELLAHWKEPPSPIESLSRLAPHPWKTSDVVITPYPAGRQCPEPDPAARVRTIGIGASSTCAARGLLQALIFQSRWMREAINAVVGPSVGELSLLGSLAARVPAWAPLLASVDGSVIHRGLSVEPVAAGAALFAAVHEQLVDSAARLASVPVLPAFTPGLDAAYDKFLALVHRADA